MSFTPKAILFSEDSAFLNFLREFLFRYGFRETQVTLDPEDISRVIQDRFWPIIFIEHTEGFSDAYAVFESIYCRQGFELLTYVFVVPDNMLHIERFAKSLGVRGVIKKPLQPLDAGRVMKELMPSRDDPATAIAMQASRYLLMEDFDKALPLLGKLLTVGAYSRAAFTAVTRCEIATGQFSKAEERLSRLITSNPRDIRALCEYVEIFKKRAEYSKAIRYYRMIRSFHPEMTIKIWEEIILHLELDEIDEASQILQDLMRIETYREPATEALSRIMLFMGLEEYIPQFLKSYPALGKKFQTHLLELKAGEGPSS